MAVAGPTRHLGRRLTIQGDGTAANISATLPANIRWANGKTAFDNPYLPPILA